MNWTVFIMINIDMLFILILRDVSSNIILPEYEQCNGPLGMESGSIADSDLSCSSTHDITSVGPQMARIRLEIEGGAWCPDKPIGPNSYEYIEIELHKLFYINAIETQGRFDNGQGNEYAEYYQIQYQRENNLTHWIYYYDKKTNKTIVKGNLNTYLAEKRYLSTSIIAKRIRIIPYSTRWRTICMRIELYGCPFYGGVISYTTSSTINRDNTYDGQVGKLTDGIIGKSDNACLRWNRSFALIKFQFDTYRQFKIIRIYTMNSTYRTIEIQFENNISIKHQSSSMQDTLQSNIYVDTIQLNRYGTIFIGKRLSLLFQFDNLDHCLTEITFNNQPTTLINTTMTNLTELICSTNEQHHECFNSNRNITIISSVTSSMSTIYPLEWLIILLIIILSLTFILLFIIFINRVRRCYSKKTNFYSKCSQLTKTTNNTSTSMDHQRNDVVLRKMNYDDMTSMGSYIYPITSTTSLLQTSPPSSIVKCGQYAMIDGNCPSNHTFHYASSDIGQSCPMAINLFDCSKLEELRPLLCNYSFPPYVDDAKLVSFYKLSQTHYGEIYFGKYSIDNQSKFVLIKSVKSNQNNKLIRQKFLSELNVLSRLNHINIAYVLAVHIDGLYFIQEHSDLGTLQDYFRTNINDVTFQKMNIYFALQLSNALEYLSDLSIIHNDVATRNCLFFADFTIKLTDCAMALSQYEHEYWLRSNDEKMPLRWIAPESLINNRTLKSDIYSFGVTLWELWSRCLYLPYASLTNEELYQYLLTIQASHEIENSNQSMFVLSQPNDCPKEIYDLLTECWQIDGTKRPNISDIVFYFRRQIQNT